MTHHLPRRITLLAAFGFSLAFALSACGHATSPGSAPGARNNGSGARATTAAEDLTPTRWGPLSAADTKLLTIVRQTSLREITTSKWALQRSSNPKVKQAAQMIINQHVVLDSKDLALAAKLGLQLPDKPAPDMQVGIDRMRTEQGQTFDTDYVNTLRQAHGVASILLANVRADTRNTLVRPFADFAANFIHNHIVMLEKTGLVDYTKLPVPSAS
jgi:predicted outer membrane protein